MAQHSFQFGCNMLKYGLIGNRKVFNAFLRHFKNQRMNASSSRGNFALEMAIRLASMRGFNKRSSGPKVCFACGLVGHLARNCPIQRLILNVFTNSYSGLERLCYICRLAGHIARYCPMKQPKRNRTADKRKPFERKGDGKRWARVNRRHKINTMNRQTETVKVVETVQEMKMMETTQKVEALVKD